MQREVQNNKATTNDYLANERTFLAWVRTAIGIMAFGFVVVKFSIFIRQIYVLLDKEHVVMRHQPTGYSGTLGILLVVAGLITLMISYFNYHFNIKKLEQGSFNYSSLHIDSDGF